MDIINLNIKRIHWEYLTKVMKQNTDDLELLLYSFNGTLSLEPTIERDDLEWENQNLCFLDFILKQGFIVAQASLKLTMYLRLALNFWASPPPLKCWNYKHVPLHQTRKFLYTMKFVKFTINTSGQNYAPIHRLWNYE